MLFLALYLIGYLICWRNVCWFFIEDISGGDGLPEGEVLFFGAVTGTIFNVIWPLILVGKAVHLLWTHNTDQMMKILIPKRARRNIELHLLEEKNATSERRIRQLERELEIGG